MTSIRNPRWLLLGIIASAMAARAGLLWSTPWVPGMNGAYYLVQARAVLERGTLGIPDMPLTFYLQAGVAWLINFLHGGAPAQAILLAVKLCDALLPPLAAWPVFVLTQRWAASLGRGAALPLTAAALAALGFPLMSMVGDFQKNSLALVWLAALCLALYSWLDTPTRGHGIRLLACLALLGLTHIGVLGAALVLTVAVSTVALALRGLGQWRTRAPWLAGGAVVVLLAGGLVLWKFDPARIHRLAGALIDPAGFSNDGLQGPGPGGPRGPGGSGGAMALLRCVPLVIFGLAAIPALVIVYRGRRAPRAIGGAVAAGCALAVLALTGPWFSMDKSMRFVLIAFIPAVLAGTFALLHARSTWVRGVVAGLALLIFAGGGIAHGLHGGRPILSDAALHELAALAPQITTPEHTLISAQHGAEWWTAWLLRTHIAQSRALRAEDWHRYDVLFLQVKGGMQMPMMAPGGRPSRGGPPPGAGGPPPFAGLFGPPGGPGHMPPGGGGPMGAAAIPDDATIIHNGPCLKLARVLAPPESVVAQSNAPAAR